MSEKYKYKKIYNDILRKVDSGEYKPGDKLPGQRLLMNMYGVSFATITSALSDLERDHIIVRKHGKGTFIQDSVPEINKLELRPGVKKLRFGIFLTSIVSNPAGVFKGIYEESQSLGVELEFILYDGEKERRARCDDILKGVIKVDACLIMHLPGYDDVVESFNRAGFPYLVIDAPCVFKGVNQILFDYEKGAFAATNHLIKHGHEHIGFLLGSLKNEDEEEYWTAAKMRGYAGALTDGGMAYNPEYVHVMEKSSEANVIAGVEELTARGKISALFVAVGRHALLAIDTLQKMNCRVPRDIAIVSFNVKSMDVMGKAPYLLSGIHVPMLEGGRQAVRFLAKIVSGELSSQPPHLHELPLPFIRRNSCGCA